MSKTAIVTGGSRGIGHAIAKRLGLDGFNIVIMAVSPKERRSEQLKELDSLGIRYIYVQGSIAAAGDRNECLGETISNFGRVDVLVNNAGVAPKARTDILEMTEESFDWVMETNTKGTMFMTQLVANQMLKQKPDGQKRGTIVNISSCSAVVSSISRGEYCISKAGVSMITTLFADRLAKENVYVYEVRPGVISTDMTSEVKSKYDKMFGEGIFPIERWGRPEDVANAVSVFCSDKFSYSTGNYIDVDGGFHIPRL